jgi:hypothetical protein
MGVLDDAIREHLELKRRRGAPDDELERDEAEALGSARRAPETVPYGEEAGADPVEAEPGAVPPVHDIDVDPLAAPPPVTGAPVSEMPPPEGPDEPGPAA